MEVYDGKMRFLKKSKIPGELPDLALGASPLNQRATIEPTPITQTTPQQISTQTEQGVLNNLREEPKIQAPTRIITKREIAGEDYLEFSPPEQNTGEREQIKQQLNRELGTEEDQKSFFDQVLEDINGEIKDLGKLENWYKDKFLPQDVVSNMRLYWEDNKADMIIRSFGSEYKQKINEKIKYLQELEADWREIYFKLIKKEEEMKREERTLKETLSEFVDLCKRRRTDSEKENKR